MDAVVLYPPIGTSQDAPNENGSLHAKIAELREYIDTQLATVQKPRAVHGAPGSFSTSQTTFQTALYVTGRGRLLKLGAISQTGVTMFIAITIDGIAIVNAAFVGTTGTYKYPDHVFTILPSASASFSEAGDPANAQLSYKESLKIEIAASAANTVQLFWQYEHE